MKKVKILLLFCVIGLLVSCHTIQYVPVEKVRTEYINKSDTCIIRDSVYVNKWQSADTVYVDKLKYKYIYSVTTDTILKTDTVPVIKEVEVPVKYVPGYYKKVNAAFWCLIVILGLYVGVKLYFRLK